MNKRQKRGGGVQKSLVIVLSLLRLGFPDQAVFDSASTSSARPLLRHCYILDNTWRDVTTSVMSTIRYIMRQLT